MAAGYLVDHGYGIAYPAAWAAGVPRWSRLLGLRLRGVTKLPVTTYRCPRCGRLESYAEARDWPA